MAEQQAPPLEPPWLRIARGELGVREIAGAPNERVNEYLASVGAEPGQDWCAAFVTWCLEEAGQAGLLTGVARRYLKYGTPITKPEPGCVVVFWRVSRTDWRGHVGFYVSQSAQKIRVVSGNSGKAVRLSGYPTAQLLGYRRVK